MKDVNLNTSFAYERGNQTVSGATANVPGSTESFAETYNSYSGALSASYQLMRRLSLSLNYRLIHRNSNIDSRTYMQNQVGLLLTYQLP